MTIDEIILNTGKTMIAIEDGDSFIAPINVNGMLVKKCYLNSHGRYKKRARLHF